MKLILHHAKGQKGSKKYPEEVDMKLFYSMREHGTGDKRYTTIAFINGREIDVWESTEYIEQFKNKS